MFDFDRQFASWRQKKYTTETHVRTAAPGCPRMSLPLAAARVDYPHLFHPASYAEHEVLVDRYKHN
jgi:hypothetical protein